MSYETFSNHSSSIQKQILSHVRFLLSTHLYDLEDCYQEGYEDFLNQKQLQDNPYLVETPAYRAWEDGWWKACFTPDETEINSKPPAKWKLTPLPLPVQVISSTTLIEAANDPYFEKNESASVIISRGKTDPTP